ncbi:SemiSWEET transporter [Rickettsiales bacterium]|nr:SemiSWEET transporter [Rickettsiales bacterium]
MDYINIVVAIAAFLTTISFIPQAIKIIRTKDTSAISLVMYLLFTVGVFFWIIFGILIKTNIIIIANIITFTFAFIILSVKIKNILNGTDK